MAQKPSLPKGTRDFTPKELSRRKYIIRTIERHFERFGFDQIETPSLENLSTLTGKYGEEGDRLIFKILNSGDYLNKIDKESLVSATSNELTHQISSKALRYDLTVPFARFVVMNQNELVMPFKRYQIQPVWRADRPQKGRYREFFQCDADAIGSDSLVQEVEFIMLYDGVFDDLNVAGTCIRVNNRKILAGIVDILQISDRLIDFTVSLDKLDKIGQDGVLNELNSKGFSSEVVDSIRPFLELSGDWRKQLEFLNELLGSSSVGKEGLEELSFVFEQVTQLGLKTSELIFDITLARGLNYYTGIIIEVTAPKNVKIGSIGGGGRYDDLTAPFGLKNMSGVGISFGLDRIALVLDELNLFPAALDQKVDAVVLNFGEKEMLKSLKLAQQLRDLNLVIDCYPNAAKLQKQFKYVDKKNAAVAIMIGSTESANDTVILKNMQSGEQKEYSCSDLEGIQSFITA
ncbi:MAG: histidine--tRNA ligase [Flavobacteriaceae bacterium]